MLHPKLGKSKTDRIAREDLERLHDIYEGHTAALVVALKLAIAGSVDIALEGMIQGDDVVRGSLQNFVRTFSEEEQILLAVVAHAREGLTHDTLETISYEGVVPGLVSTTFIESTARLEDLVTFNARNSMIRVRTLAW